MLDLEKKKQLKDNKTEELVDIDEEDQDIDPTQYENLFLDPTQEEIEEEIEIAKFYKTFWGNL